MLDARHFRLAPATFVQRAGTVGFKGLMEPHGKKVMNEFREEFNKRRKFFCERMDEIDGISCPTFEGAFYAFPDISSLGIPTDEFISKLKEEEGVNVMSGEFFGGVDLIGEESPAYRHIRPPLVQDLDVLEEAADKIERFVENL